MNEINLEKKLDESICPECRNAVITITGDYTAIDKKIICSVCGLVINETAYSSTGKKAYTAEEKKAKEDHAVITEHNPHKLAVIDSKVRSYKAERGKKGFTDYLKIHGTKTREDVIAKLEIIAPELPKYIKETAMIFFENILQKKRCIIGKSLDGATKACLRVALRLFKNIKQWKILMELNNYRHDPVDFSNNARYMRELGDVIVNDKFFKDFTQKRGIKYVEDPYIADAGMGLVNDILNENPRLESYLKREIISDVVWNMLNYFDKKKVGQGKHRYAVAAGALYYVISHEIDKLQKPLRERREELEDKIENTCYKLPDTEKEIKEISKKLNEIDKKVLLSQDYLAKKADVVEVTIRSRYKSAEEYIPENILEKIIEHCTKKYNKETV